MRTWGAPFVIAAVSASGLVGALLGEGLVDTLATTAAAAPLAVGAWALFARRR